jgi:transcription elongation factor Elf1
MHDVHFHCAICGTALAAVAGAAGAVAECHACGRYVPVPGLIHLPGASAGCAPAFPEEILGVELRFRCPRCTTKLSIDVRWEGHEVSCPKCNLQTKVPRWSRTRPAVLGQLSDAEIEFLSAAESRLAAG